MRATKEAYGWDPDAHFLVPGRGGRALPLGGGRAAAPPPRPSGTSAPRRTRPRTPSVWAELSLVMDGGLPDGWDSDPPRFDPADDPIATRKASQQVIQWAAAQVPHLVSGSADLEPSTLTLIDDGGSVTRDDYSGRNVHYGVREHGMGGDRERAQPPRPARVRLHVLQLPRLHEGRGAPGGAHAPAGDPRVHPRLDRPRRGRPDPPADRAARAPARHAERERGAPGATRTRPRLRGSSRWSSTTGRARWC